MGEVRYRSMYRSQRAALERGRRRLVRRRWFPDVLPRDRKVFKMSNVTRQDIEDLDHYEMKEEEPVDGKKSEDDGIEKENLAILEKIRKNQRQDHLNVSFYKVRSLRFSCATHGELYYRVLCLYYYCFLNCCREPCLVQCRPPTA